MRNYSVTRAGWFWFGTVLFLVVFFTLLIVPPIVSLSQNPANPAPTATPPTIYLAHCQINGYYRAFSTTDGAWAERSMGDGYWPIPQSLYESIQSDPMQPCTRGPNDGGW